MRKLIVFIAIIVGLFFLYGGVSSLQNVGKLFQKSLTPPQKQEQGEQVKLVEEESVVIEIVEKVTPSVVTVGIEQRILEFDPFDPFGSLRRPKDQGSRDQDIGSGFIVESDGLIVTNKHVVSTKGKYKVITSDGEKYDIVKIYRDPANDIAIIKINAAGLTPVEMGESNNLKVGQLVVAMGTPLGEFRGSATKGIISGLGRGIEAGLPLEGFVERLDNVIQTDAAINPGNSGGPLVNSAGQVIGINTAVASGAENIGFAIPINVVKDALAEFNKTGGFSRPYLGVSYRMITRSLAIINEIPQGAFVVEIIEDSAADKAGVKEDDIITKIDGEKLTDDNGGLAKIISGKKVGQQVKLTVWRNEKEVELTATLGETPEE
ncbi:trypsin-like peptidase domain-containing protein [Candidatus Microgenomates bacterium]|nr:trypsin-like peptidase domain-containing protein [Candidatus Microgenomates bacterium]